MSAPVAIRRVRLSCAGADWGIAMSGKIPLDRTIGGAYTFLFSDLVSILGIAWLPSLFFGVLAAAVVWFGAVAHPLPELKFQGGRLDPAFMLGAARVVVPLFICGLLFAVMLITGFMQRALGLMEGTTYYYFNLGASFWRMLAAIIIAGLLLAILRVCLAVVAAAWVHFAAPRLPQGIAVILDILGWIALAALFIYAVVRLIFLLPAVVIAEERIGLGRAWYFARGNVGRAFLCIIAVLVPALLVLGILNVVLFSGVMHNLPTPPFGHKEHPAQGEVVAYVKKVAPFLASYVKANWPLLLLVQIVSAIVPRALFAGASANAYRGVSSETEAKTS